MSNSFYYVTAATGKEFINNYTKWAVRSLIKTGISPKNIHVIGNSKEDIKLINTDPTNVFSELQFIDYRELI